MEKPLVIGISGCAGVGKDTFAEILRRQLVNDKQIYSCSKIALAEELKEDCKEFLNDKCDIDVWTGDRTVKELFRPFLVWYGHVKRTQTNGRYWVEKVSKRIKETMTDVIIITDVRYCKYEKDEVQWITDEWKGVLVHISNFRTEDGVNIQFNHTNPKKIFVQPPNDHERENDPKVKERAHYKVEWQDQKPYMNPREDVLDNEYLNGEVKKFVDYLKQNGKL